MKTIRFLFTTLFLAAGITGATGKAQGQTGEPVAGRILSVECPAQLVRNGTRSGVTLSSPRDIALGLSAGDQVECTGPGHLDVLIASGTKRIGPSPKPFPIPPLPADPKLPKDEEIANALTGYGISGATRGFAADSRILWPSENSVVVPEHFSIRWTPLAQKIELAIFSESKDVTLWGPAEVDGSVGSLQSEAMANALAAYRAKPGSQGLVLTLTPANSSNWEEAHFSLLRGKQEQELKSHLAYWQSNTEGVALHLGRGYTYLREKLFAEAADEYDAALSSAPESLYLLQKDIEASRLAGRMSRVVELQSRLAAIR